MSGLAGTGAASFDWLLMLKDEIAMSGIVIAFDSEPEPRQRAVIEALGASVLIRGTRAA